jgi:hypothetical protein
MKIAGREISGKAAAAGAAAVGAVAVLAIVLRSGRSLEDPGSRSRVRVAIDAETGTVFERYRIQDGDGVPWKNPRTGDRTLYPAEKCFWSEDGSFKDTPTYVLLNELIGKSGPTICPDCGRAVVAHNPLPPFPGDEPSGARERRERANAGGG